MDALNALWHLLNALAPAFGVGMLAATLAKLLWRRDLSGVSLFKLARAAILAGAVASLLSVAVLGRDGKMLGYAALVLASASALWWTGFASRR